MWTEEQDQVIDNQINILQKSYQTVTVTSKANVSKSELKADTLFLPLLHVYR